MSRHIVYACESQPIVVEGLVRVIERVPEFAYGGCSPTVAEALPVLRNSRPDIVLIDQSSGFKALLQHLPQIKNVAPSAAPVLWASYISDSDSFRAVQCGARAVIRKSSSVETLVECLRMVASGEIWIENSHLNNPAQAGPRRPAPRLTIREQQILHCVYRGLANKDIAAELRITSGTVKVHLMHIFEKTGVKDRFELAVLAHRLLDGVGGVAQEPIGIEPSTGFDVPPNGDDA